MLMTAYKWHAKIADDPRGDKAKDHYHPVVINNKVYVDKWSHPIE